MKLKFFNNKDRENTALDALRYIKYMLETEQNFRILKDNEKPTEYSVRVTMLKRLPACEISVYSPQALTAYEIREIKGAVSTCEQVKHVDYDRKLDTVNAESGLHEAIFEVELDLKAQVAEDYDYNQEEFTYDTSWDHFDVGLGLHAGSEKSVNDLRKYFFDRYMEAMNSITQKFGCKFKTSYLGDTRVAKADIDLPGREGSSWINVLILSVDPSYPENHYTLSIRVTECRGEGRSIREVCTLTQYSEESTPVNNTDINTGKVRVLDSDYDLMFAQSIDEVVQQISSRLNA